jgi:hypothetical protein
MRYLVIFGPLVAVVTAGVVWKYSTNTYRRRAKFAAQSEHAHG